MEESQMAECEYVCMYWIIQAEAYLTLQIFQELQRQENFNWYQMKRKKNENTNEFSAGGPWLLFRRQVRK